MLLNLFCLSLQITIAISFICYEAVTNKRSIINEIVAAIVVISSSIETLKLFKPSIVLNYLSFELILIFTFAIFSKSLINFSSGKKRGLVKLFSMLTPGILLNIFIIFNIYKPIIAINGFSRSYIINGINGLVYLSVIAIYILLAQLLVSIKPVEPFDEHFKRNLKNYKILNLVSLFLLFISIPISLIIQSKIFSPVYTFAILFIFLAEIFASSLKLTLNYKNYSRNLYSLAFLTFLNILIISSFNFNFKFSLFVIMTASLFYLISIYFLIKLIETKQFYDSISMSFELNKHLNKNISGIESYWFTFLQESCQLLQQKYFTLEGELYLYNSKEKQYKIAAGSSEKPLFYELSENNIFIKYLYSQKKSICLPEIILSKGMEKEIQSFAVSNHIAGIVPILDQKQLTGFFLLKGLLPLSTEYISFKNDIDYFGKNLQIILENSLIKGLELSLNLKHTVERTLYSIKRYSLKSELYSNNKIELASTYFNFSPYGGDRILSQNDNDKMDIIISDSYYNGVDSMFTGIEYSSIFPAIPAETPFNKIPVLLNRYFHKKNKTFSSALFRITDGKNLSCINAGFAPIYIFNSEIEDFLEVTCKNPPIGYFANTAYETLETQLKINDWVLSVSPGFYSLCREDGIPYGIDFIKNIIKNNYNNDSQSVNRQIAESLSGAFTTGANNDAIILLIKKKDD